MKAREYVWLYRRENGYWWFVNKRRLIVAFLKRYAGEAKPLSVLDIGCGTGALMESLSGSAKIYGMDVAYAALGFCKERGLSNLAQGNSQQLPFKDKAFDVVIMSDLLEHAADDALVLREGRRVLNRGGRLILTVPAFMALWSPHDVALGHQRRYRLAGLRRQFVENGFHVERISYYMFILFLPILCFRFLKRLSASAKQPATSDFLPLPQWLNNFLLSLLGMERWLLKLMNLPWGVSLVAVARKE